MRRHTVFAASLTVSALIHLSMVTLFSVVIMFERHEQRYVQFELVKVESVPTPMQAHDAVQSADRVVLRGPAAVLESMEGAMTEFPPVGQPDLRLKAPALGAGPVPSVELPKLEFAELDRLRLRQEVLAPGLDPDRYLNRRPRDPWSELGRGIGELTDALKRLGGAPHRTPEETPLAPELISRPAPGFEAYVEWMSDPRDRLVLSTPPIQALWGRDPAELEAPISMLFTVNPEGRVIEVLNPMDDELTTSVGIALSKYRFAPLVGDDRNQQGTFRIVGAPDASGP